MKTGGLEPFPGLIKLYSKVHVSGKPLQLKSCKDILT